MQSMRDLDLEMLRAIQPLGNHTAFLHGMVAYHLGWSDSEFHPYPVPADTGKRVRPSICLLSCEAVGGSSASALPLAASVELLHNFTLIHDDIQDESELRRHRPTVWALWGSAQAINAGDALFAASHRALYGLTEHRIEASEILGIAKDFDTMAEEIVAGQVEDLRFEQSAEVLVDEYLKMINGKTAAVIEFAARSGATIGGASDQQADFFGTFGRALGMGFQVRDDYLGTWGNQQQTGKTESDDIRRRKKNLPVIQLRKHLDNAELRMLDRLYAQPEIDPSGIALVQSLLDRYQIAHEVESIIGNYHAEAIDALDRMNLDPERTAVRDLYALTDQLASRNA